jgi:hypothetical protein
MKNNKNSIKEAAVWMNTPQGPQIIQSPNGYMRNRPNKIDYFNHATKRIVPGTTRTRSYYGLDAEQNFKTEFIPLYQKLTEALSNLEPMGSVSVKDLAAKMVVNLPGGGTAQKRDITREINAAMTLIRHAVQDLLVAKQNFKNALVVLGVEKNPANPQNDHFEYYHIKENVDNMVHNSLMKLLKEQKDKGDN